LAKKESRVEACMRLESEGKTVEEIAAELGLSERNVKSYLWRGHHPEEFKAMLKRYYEKRKAKAEKKVEPEKKAKGKVKKKVEEPAAAEEPEAESTTEEKDVTKQKVKPLNPWAK